MHVLGRPDVDGAEALREDANVAFGEASLQASMTVHWAAVTRLMTDSGHEHREALDDVEGNMETAQRYGHQASIAMMLAATPRLRLPDSDRRDWVRHCLYVNAFRDR